MATSKPRGAPPPVAAADVSVDIPPEVLAHLRMRRDQVRAADQELAGLISLVAGTLMPGRRVRGVDLDKGVILFSGDK